MSEGGGRVLGVGIATLDLINEVPRWPAEDEEVRALAQHLRRGGNVTNTLVVLAGLERACTWAGTLAEDPQSGLILNDLRRHGVSSAGCVRHPGATPTSYVALSRASGSRTIVHHRDLPELAAAELAGLPLGPFDWLHFEGRNPAETSMMLAHCRNRWPGTPISVELEKPRPEIESLFDGPDVLIFSRVFARSRGFEEPGRFLAEMRRRTGAGLLILPWGADGAYGLAREGSVRHAPAHPPPAVVDTLGAGDVFNAAVIDGLLTGLALDALLARANRLAGHKCGRPGFDGLVASARAAGLI
jgi:ketohexokinase